MTVVQDLKDRLYSFLQNSVNINKVIETIATAPQDTTDVMDYILAQDSLDNTEGDGLDFMGSLIGSTRPRAQEAKIFTLRREGEVDADAHLFGFHDLTDDTGGFLTTEEGLEDQGDPEALMPDDDYRKLIKQRSATLNRRATHEQMFSYLIEFGARCIVDDDTDWKLVIRQVTWSDFNNWQRNYVETRGFKPSRVSVEIEENLVHEESI